MTYEEKIERGLKLYLKEVCHVKGNVERAKLSEFDSGGGDGCDTCGNGETGASFDIDYRVDGKWSYKLIEMDPLQFFSELLPYIDRAN